MQEEMFGCDELHPVQTHHRVTHSRLVPSKEQWYRPDKLRLFLKTLEQHFSLWTDYSTLAEQKCS